MEELRTANKILKTARASHEQDYDNQISMLDGKELSLVLRLRELDEKKAATARSNGEADPANDDRIEVNAGGTIIVAKRSTLTQLKGTRMEALFSGRWDKKLQRDNHGRIFLDVNPIGFRAIVDYLNEMAISSEDDHPSLPTMEGEYKLVIRHQLELFGLLDNAPKMEMPDSSIVEDEDRAAQLHDWLKEDESDGEFCLLYRSSRDGLSNANFHSKCDNQGCTITIVETSCGYIIGGYSNTPWKSTGKYRAATKTFLFVLSGPDISSPCKMKKKNANDTTAVWHGAALGAAFGKGGMGIDFRTDGSNVYVRFGRSYESGPPGRLKRSNNDDSYTVLPIKEMEVFRVTETSSSTSDKLVIRHQLKLFGLLDNAPKMEMPDSSIVKDEDRAAQLHDWLKEDESDGEFCLLYRSSRDGLSNANFHSKCDNQGCTITIVETSCGYIIGGYSNTPWKSTGKYRAATKTFLFVLSGPDISSPCKMKKKNANDATAVFDNSGYGPTFGEKGMGCDFLTNGSFIHVRFGRSYESDPSGRRISLAIKEMEVFRVTETSSSTSATIASPKHQRIRTQIGLPRPVTRFSEDINKAINAKQQSLLTAESEILHLEDSFKDERNFITTFASGDAKDVVTLNVSGVSMVTKRSTLQVVKDSVLAHQFDDTKWKQGCDTPRVKEWSPDEVNVWIHKIPGIPNDVVDIFKENEITGYELLALKREGLAMIGITRPGPVCVLVDEIKKLEKESLDFVTLIEHSPYCFGRILDHLRLKQLHSQGLAEEPASPTVCESQMSRFEKVVKYYFPGDIAKSILG
eukprot:CAMPEP_0201682104 /NCGR_PEP_ID=MMETSP0494-20130426/51449_1 /ASSEMBLY_ACC=CAM_ASM_000839 /TAXON_ID=420259 /ORGANISM="Thalassiosira gravida, Strain GMp14c1" /LENGTH=801 /DNA_ID=CAMNT_0048165861 /DNA_START=4489 /DNA_END=6894 /DNA_ORIENTATION=-